MLPQLVGLALLAVIRFTPLPAQGSPISIIPEPVSMKVRRTFFTLSPGTAINTDRASAALGRQLAGMLVPATGYPLPVRVGEAPAANQIVIRHDASLMRLGPEGYLLEVTPARVSIRAPAPAGIFYAFQTVRQLLPIDIFRDARLDHATWTIPAVLIEDYPRFPWRGAHLDVCRHFMPKEFVKKYLDLMALHKLNSFHWHLTEDQGWRIEIRKYPQLTEIGGWRKETLVGRYDEDSTKWVFDGVRHGGYYTQDDVREIVAYAQDRFINVVPEIEMPGHSQAAIAAYPELGNTGRPLDVMTWWGVSENILNPSEKTIGFMEDVLTEVLGLFPGKFIHTGGDEADKTQWKASAEVQARIRELGLKNEEELQGYFTRSIDAWLASKGRRLVGWDEILEGGLAPGAVVMSWRGEDGGIAAARAGHDVVMAPGHSTYFDHYQSQNRDSEPLAIGGFLPLDTVYAYDPVPAVLDAQAAKHILGAQGQVWTEYIQNPKQVEYMAYPRTCALAEVLWTPKARKNFTDFTARLETHLQRLTILDVNFRPLGP